MKKLSTEHDFVLKRSRYWRERRTARFAYKKNYFEHIPALSKYWIEKFTLNIEISITAKFNFKNGALKHQSFLYYLLLFYDIKENIIQFSFIIFQTLFIYFHIDII